MRLDKYLSHATGASRSQVHHWLRHKRILVNGVLCTQAAHPLTEPSEVLLDGEAVTLPQDGYWMLHKPQGVVCANTDGHYPTVIDLVSSHLAPHHLQIAGRLDVDTTGLVLITTDGRWNHQITAPKKHCQKIYRVQLSQPLNPEHFQQLNEGIHLHGEKKPCLAAEAFALNTHHYLLAIYEGKYHQVKRMMAALNNHVVNLHRIAIGGVQLSTLAPGQFRPLLPSEITQLANKPQCLKLAEVAQHL
ncbi:MAG: rRNA pseudouridine synthase RsuA [Pseudomonadota bacterium]|jgi:16S rRNA pseudouridine516 synthase